MIKFKTQVVETQLTRCNACGSTERMGYNRVESFDHRDAGGIDPATSKPATHRVSRWTNCKNCGQARIDVHYENRI